MDAIDLRIIELLTQNARMDNRQIARKVGTSDRTVARRINKLEAQGVIESYTIKLGPQIYQDIYAVEPVTGNTIVSEWESIRSALTKFFGSGASMILFQIGYGIGKSLGDKLQEISLNPSSQISAFTQILEDRGWGSLDLRQVDLQKCKGTFMFRNPPLKEQQRAGANEVKGMITGFLESLFATTITVTEAKEGHRNHCHYELEFKGVHNHGD